jgi:hypothetical protein
MGLEDYLVDTLIMTIFLLMSLDMIFMPRPSVGSFVYGRPL